MKSALLIILLASTSLYAKHKMMPMEMTAEQRQGMATAHENMAACLKSDKTVEACHSEMMTTCKSVMGAEGCKMGHMKKDKMMK